MSKVNQKQAKALKETTKSSKPAVAKPEITKSASKKVATKDTVLKVGKVTKPAKDKTPKLKMERDSFTMPKNEYAQFSLLKERLIKLGQPAKKSELIRAGIMQLTAMTDTALKAGLSKVLAIKTDQPNNK